MCGCGKQAEVSNWKSKRATEAARADAADAANATLLAELESAQVQLKVAAAIQPPDIDATSLSLPIGTACAHRWDVQPAAGLLL